MSTAGSASASNSGVQSLPEVTGKPLEESLNHLVENSDAHSGARNDTLAPSELRADAVHSHGEKSKGWISKFFPSAETLDKLFNYEHMGNYVIDRETGRKNFETMPLYVRVGMHLLFVNGAGYVSYNSVEKLLLNQSLKQGNIYDQTGEGVKEHIQSFIDTYQLPLNELLVEDLSQYSTFNAFFSRRLKATARPITSPNDPSIITSPADCRLTVFNTVDEATTFWIKGKEFSIPSLIYPDPEKPVEELKSIATDPTCSLAVARLAPQDYHRFHSPVSGTIKGVWDIPGELYTVNPQAVNEDLNVFTRNKRSVMLIHADLGPGKETIPVAFVAVGAMLVGSIGWSKKAGDTVVKGEELGWFQYGGSTVITVFPHISGVVFDKDLAINSENKTETLVKVGMEIAKAG